MITPRTSVLEAVSAAIALNPEMSGMLAGGIWTGEIPEGQSMPYGSLEVDSSQFECTSGYADLERTNFSIVIFGVLADGVDNILDKLQDYLSNFDYTSSFTNSDWLVFLLPGKRSTRSEFARDKDGNQIFTGAVMFEAAVFRH